MQARIIGEKDDAVLIAGWLPKDLIDQNERLLVDLLNGTCRRREAALQQSMPES